MKYLLCLMLLLTGCLFVPAVPQEDSIEMVQVGVFAVGGGCALSKVAIFDDEGNQYQAEGCTHGTIAFPEGRSFGWVDSLGTELQGFNVVLIR